MKRLTLPMDRLTLDPGVQGRVLIDLAMIDEYAEAYLQGAPFPAVAVVTDGKTLWLVDGFTRYHARQKACLKDIGCEVTKGNRRAAILAACAANSTHGVRPTAADKRLKVGRLLADPEWRQWSDREIARRCGVGNHLVAQMRAEQGHMDDHPPNRRQCMRGGTEYEMECRPRRGLSVDPKAEKDLQQCERLAARERALELLDLVGEALAVWGRDGAEACEHVELARHAVMALTLAPSGEDPRGETNRVKCARCGNDWGRPYFEGCPFCAKARGEEPKPTRRYFRLIHSKDL
jgi:hypothetical protein